MFLFSFLSIIDSENPILPAQWDASSALIFLFVFWVGRRNMHSLYLSHFILKMLNAYLPEPDLPCPFAQGNISWPCQAAVEEISNKMAAKAVNSCLLLLH